MFPNKKSHTLIIVVIMAVAIIAALNLLPAHRPIDHKWNERFNVTSPQFSRALGLLMGPPLVGGNKLRAYQNGSEIFPAMLQAIRSAQKTITFEAYIYWSDKVGQQFIEALCERARAGVKVYVLVDWLGSRQLKDEFREKMRKAGVQLEIYRPPSLENIIDLNNRTHRRILVIDGKRGFTGGVGICDDWNWDGQAEAPDKWRDSQFEVEGPAVAYLQSAFMDNWMKLHAEVPADESFFPALKEEGPAFAQVFKSSYEEGSESVRLMFQLAIVSAQKSIHIASAYFLPDQNFVQELIRARQRGVKIQIIVPGPYIDTNVVKHASRAEWGDLLKNGIEIYEYQPARFHFKLLVIDGAFTSVGSTNFDNRSFRLNDEANLNVLDTNFAAQAIETFEKDRLRSRLVTLQEWEHRPLDEKIKEDLAKVVGSQL